MFSLAGVDISRCLNVMRKVLIVDLQGTCVLSENSFGGHCS